MTDRYPDPDTLLRSYGLLALATEKVLGAQALSAADEVKAIGDWPAVPAQHVEHDPHFPALEPLGFAACLHILR